MKDEPDYEYKDFIQKRKITCNGIKMGISLKLICLVL